MFKIVAAKDGKKVMLRSVVASDVKRAKEYADYINSIIAEKDYILLKKKIPIKEEKEAIKGWISGYKKGKHHIIAEFNGNIIGVMDVAKQLGTMDHVAIMGISLRKGYRSIGLGSELMKVAEEIARGMRCKCLRLAVYPTNKKAIGLYRKFGFRKVASIPKQIQRKGKLISEDIMIMNL